MLTRYVYLLSGSLSNSQFSSGRKGENGTPSVSFSDKLLRHSLEFHPHLLEMVIVGEDLLDMVLLHQNH